MTTAPQAGDPIEVVPAVIRVVKTGRRHGVPPVMEARATMAVVTPTQVRRPWKSTARTLFQAFVGLCVLAPLLVQTAGLNVEQLPWLATVLVVAGAITRVMALPGVESWLQKYLRFLAAAPAPRQED